MASYDLRLIFFAFSFWLSNNAGGEQNLILLSTLAPKLELTETECASQYSCIGCHQIRICSTSPHGKFRLVSVVNCTGIMQYCKEDSGTCTAIMPGNCAEMSDNFVCMRESGSYPDATNCSRYHVCKNYTAFSFSCYGGTKYNSWTGRCERCDCQRFNCANKNGLKVPYGNNKKVYAYCVSGLLWFIDRCPTGYELNEVTQNCEPVCKMEGFLADSADSSSYYVCWRDPNRGNNLLPLRRVCPAGKLFDLNYVNCVSAKEKEIHKGLSMESVEKI